MKIALLFAALVIPLTACQALDDVLDGLKGSSAPEARITGVTLNELTLDGATLGFDVEVTNPYDVPLPLMDLDYGLASSGTQFLSGRLDVDGQIDAGGTRTLAVPARVRFAELLQVLRDVRPGSVVPYELDIALEVDAPVVGPITVPVTRKGEIPVPAVPDISLESVAWGELSLAEASATLKLRVGNVNDFPFDLRRLDYRLSLGGSRIVETALARTTSFDERGEALVEIPIAFAPGDLGFAVFNMLTGEGAVYELKGAMDVTTPYGPLDMPFHSRGETSFLR